MLTLLLLGCVGAPGYDTDSEADPGLTAVAWAASAGDVLPDWAASLEREYGADEWPVSLEFAPAGDVLVDGVPVEFWSGGEYTGGSWGGWPVREYTVAGEAWEAAGAGEDPYRRTWAIDAEGLVFGLYPHPGD